GIRRASPCVVSVGNVDVPRSTRRGKGHHSMRISTHARAAGLVASAALLAAALVPPYVGASSHREAPMISQDPAADATDFYMFKSPDRSDTITLIANYYP